MDAESHLSGLLDRKAMQAHVTLGSRILVGLSGGADSVALLRALLVSSKKLSIELTAVHVNHRLRASADKDEAFVTHLCSTLKVPVAVRRLKPGRKPGQVSPEQYWRDCRYKEFADVISETKAEFLALGHNANDLAETFLYHVARGTGISGLTFDFVNTFDGIEILRPLWKTDRKDIESALIDIGQPWVDDPTNKDTQYSRNLIRHRIIPVLQQINPAVVTAIVHLSADLNRNHTQQTSICKPDRCEFLCIKNLKLSESLPVEIRHFVQSVYSASMDRRQTTQAVEMIRESKTGTVALAGKKTLVLTQETAWVYPGAEPDDHQLALEHARRFGGFFSYVGGCITTYHQDQWVSKALDGSVHSMRSDYPGELMLRNRQPGDRVGTTLLSKVMKNLKIPWYLRNFIVLAVNREGQIIGVCGHSTMHEWIIRHLGLKYTLEISKSGSCA